MEAKFSVIPGGHYQARQNVDGTWDVKDVPVFSTVPKGVKGAPRDITEDELREAVRLHERMFTDDRFLPRLNVLHNYGIHKATAAGFFLPRRVAPFRMKGETVPVIFADLIGVCPDVFAELQSNHLPYCSVEIREWEPLQFGALALLDTEPPFFEFPLITVNPTEAVTASAVRFQSDERSPAVAAFVSGSGSRFLFRFPDTKETPMAEDEKKDTEDEAQMAEGDGMDVASVVKAIESGEIAVKDFDAIIAAIDARTGATEPEAEGETEEPPVEFKEESKKKEDAQFSGRIAALEARIEQGDREKARDRLFSATVKSLEEDGYFLPEKTRKSLFSFASKGEATLTDFVDAFRETARQDPPETLGDFGATRSAAFPAEVMKFAERSPQAFTEAKAAFSVWSSFPDDKHRSPLEIYLKREVG